MSDDEQEMKSMRNSTKFKALQQRKQMLGRKAVDINARYAPKTEDEAGFRLPQPKAPTELRKRDAAEPPVDEDDDNAVPQDFGRKYHAVENVNVHNLHARKSLAEADHEAAEEAKKREEDEEENMMVGPPVPTGLAEPATTVGPQPAGNAMNSDEDFVAPDVQLPITHQVTIKGHNKSVVALDLDALGNRMITGGSDYQVNIYDFQGMNELLREFRTLQPFDGYPVTSLDFNKTGGTFLVCAGKSTVKVYTRDGIEVQETLKGDMYIRDMTHTRGHTCAVNEAHWNPVEKNLFMTASYDGTLRLWDLMSKHVGLDQNLMNLFVLKLRGKNGIRSPANTCCYSKDGTLLAGGSQDGGIHIWHNRSYFATADMVQHSAHTGEVSSLCFSEDSVHLYSRACDHTLKLWDIRQFSAPVHVWDGLTNDWARTRVTLSPNEKYILTPTNMINPYNRNTTVGRLVIIDTKTQQTAARINVCHSQIQGVVWSHDINQIVVGCGDGSTRVLYSPGVSTKGIMQPIARKAKSNVEDHIEYERPVITLDTVYLIKQNKPKEKRVLEMREDSKLSQKPEAPRKGRLAGSSLTQYIMTQINKLHDREKDPKEALLEYQEQATKNPEWVTPAYASTQPTTIYDSTKPTREEVNFFESVRVKKCAKCGQKFCTCNKRLGDDDEPEPPKKK